MTSNPVYIIGGFQTDFARNFAREGKEIGDIVRETSEGVLQNCYLQPQDVQSIHVGNAFGELFNHQAQMGAMPASVDPRYWGIPAARHEAACASGSIAILAAMAEIEAGRYDCVLVLGAEQERNVSGLACARYLGSAAWSGHEAQGWRFVWPGMFNQLAEEYQRRYGLQYQHLAAIAQTNYANARRNPLAQTRAWEFNERSFLEDDEHNKVVMGMVRRNDCGQVTDGGAAVVLASARYAQQWAHQHGLQRADLPQILGWGHKTVGLSLQSKFEHSEQWVMPHLRSTIVDALQRAAVGDVRDLDGIETHDCFAMTQYLAIDHFGITAPGMSWQAIESGELEFGGSLPMNPSGGLIGAGHPVGASGIRMLWDAAKQVSGKAGDYQVAGARRFATLNIGGSASTAVCFVVGAAAH